MSATVPITSQMVADGGSFMQLGGAQEAPPEAVGVAQPTGGHATNVHVGLWVLGATGLIVAWHLSGFRMAFDVGMGR